MVVGLVFRRLLKMKCSWKFELASESGEAHAVSSISFASLAIFRSGLLLFDITWLASRYRTKMESHDGQFVVVWREVKCKIIVVEGTVLLYFRGRHPQICSELRLQRLVSRLLGTYFDGETSIPCEVAK